MNIQKKAKQLERYFKGVSNAKRIKILLLLKEESDFTLDQISEKLKTNIKTTHEHTKRLYEAGLIRKYRTGPSVTHSLSPYGKEFVRFMKKF